MIKKILFYSLVILTTIPILVNASTNSNAKIGGKYYDSLEEAIANASSTDTIMLTSNVTLEDTLEINKTVNLNLNGRTISASSQVLLVQGGTLNLTGEGTIKETQPDMGAIMIKGSNSSSDTNYSVVNIGENITLEGWSGIFINHDSQKAYGIVVNFAGKINAIEDTSGGSGIGIYVNGQIQHQDNHPIVNIQDNAQINSNGNGLYIAGYSTFNIGQAYISGLEAGIGIKAGILNINGTTVVCTGEDNTPTEGYGNGMNASGTALQIESNTGYAGNMEINLNNGNFQSKNSNVIYEYIGKGTSTQVKDINISSGTFVSTANKNVFAFSDSFKTKHPDFITGGTYSSDPSSYLASGYTSNLDNGLYTVLKTTLKETTQTATKFQNQGTNNILKTILTLTIIGILSSLVYINRTKLTNLLK